MILAIDPGNELSAYVITDGEKVIQFDKRANWEILKLVGNEASCGDTTICACERIRSYGMPAGKELFETCEWSGRFQERWRMYSTEPTEWVWIERKQVKLNLCGTTKAKDSNIRQAIIDRFGGKDVAIGRKAKPGPLYGISKDCWAALAVALTYLDRSKAGVV